MCILWEPFTKLQICSCRSDVARAITILFRGFSETKPDGIDREVQQKRINSRHSSVDKLLIPEQVE
jgi:hypothetical protein